MVRTKKQPVQHIDPGHVSTRSDTGHRHKPTTNPSRWNNYDPFRTGGLTPWSTPGSMPTRGPQADEMRSANRAWRQEYPGPTIDLNAARVPSLQILARRKVSGLDRYALRPDGSFRR